MNYDGKSVGDRLPCLLPSFPMHSTCCCGPHGASCRCRGVVCIFSSQCGLCYLPAERESTCCGAVSNSVRGDSRGETLTNAFPPCLLVLWWRRLSSKLSNLKSPRNIRVSRKQNSLHICSRLLLGIFGSFCFQFGSTIGWSQKFKC